MNTIYCIDNYARVEGGVDITNSTLIKANDDFSAEEFICNGL